MVKREKVFDGRREEKYLNLNKIKKKEGGIFFFKQKKKMLKKK